MKNLLNPKLIQYDPKKIKFMQVNENKEYQAVSLSKEGECVLSLPHTRDKNNNKQQENAKNFQPSLSHSRHKRCAT